MSRQNELNPLLWLATQASKMVLFCENFVFWITLHVHVTSCSKLTKCIQRNCVNNNNEAVLTMSTSNSCLYSDLNCSLEIIDQDFEFAQKVIFMPQSCTCTLEYKWCAKLFKILVILVTETGVAGYPSTCVIEYSAVQKNQKRIKITDHCYWLFHFQFIPWKKKYFLLKKRDSSSEDEMIKLLDDNGLLDVDLFPRNLAR